MKEIGAELGDIELYLARVAISHDSELPEDVFCVFTGVQCQDDVENIHFTGGKVLLITQFAIRFFPMIVDT